MNAHPQNAGTNDPQNVELEHSQDKTTESVQEKTQETSPLDALTAENTDLKDKLLRALAEAENTRKRAEKDVQDAAQYAMQKFAKDMLSVADNFARAKESVPQDALETLKAVVEGLDVVEKELHQIFNRYGVEKINAAGQKFDPHLHQAMFEAPQDGLEAGVVFQVIQEGYTLKGRVLRPALVGVTK